MDLKSDSLYWPAKNGVPTHFGSLLQDISTEIVIIGGGITGALVALSFSDAGYQVCVIDKRKIAHGSTSASTALLQYEIDLSLTELTDKIGKKNAERAYHLCAEAIPKIQKIADRFNGEFTSQPSIYFASDQKQIAELEKEFSARQAAEFKVEWLDQDQLKHQYQLEAFGAIRSELGGSIDPYKLTYNIFNHIKSNNARIFEETEITEIHATKEKVTLTTNQGHHITAKHLIFATGYETQHYLKEKIVKLKSTYALISKPLSPNQTWRDRALLWNTDDPYLYARLTTDNRLLFGGADLPFHNYLLRDILIGRQTRKVEKQFKEVMPNLEFDVEYRWGGTFGETQDGLAYIGASPEWENTSFALGFGGNGITYSALAAELLLQQYQQNPSEDLQLFKFGR